MDSTGDEKRIRALFSELSIQETQAAPHFDKLWCEALITPPARRFNKALVVVAAEALLLAVALSFAAWSSYKSSTQQNAHTVTPRKFPTPPRTYIRQSRQVATNHSRTPSRSSRRRSDARRQQQERALQRRAAMLASWKSPTENFMTSPTASAFNSLPQLNESVKELQSFLPKESNQ